MKQEYAQGQGQACVHNNNNQGLAGHLEQTGWGRKPVCTRSRGQTSLAVKLL